MLLKLWLPELGGPGAELDLNGRWSFDLPDDDDLVVDLVRAVVRGAVEVEFSRGPGDHWRAAFDLKGAPWVYERRQLPRNAALQERVRLQSWLESGAPPGGSLGSNPETEEP